MNKGIVKLELITEWIILLIWLFFGAFCCCKTFLFFLLAASEEFYHLIKIIIPTILILYIIILGKLICNLKYTTKYYNIIKHKTKSARTEAGKVFLFVINIISTILWTTIGFIFFVFLIAFTAPNSQEPYVNANSAKGFIEGFLTLSGIYFGSIFTLVNSFPALQKFAGHRKLSPFDLICLIGSIIPFGLILIPIIIELF